MNLFVVVLKPVNHTGIVKFRGQLDANKYDARVYVGVRMDDQGNLYRELPVFCQSRN